MLHKPLDAGFAILLLSSLLLSEHHVIHVVET